MTNRGVVALTGRTEECRFLDAAWSGGRGVVLAGVQGVGKTRLAREFLAERERAGVPTDWISGVSGLSEVPLAPFLSFGADMGTVVAQLTPPTGSRKVVVVDDGQLLDALSAEVVHRMSVTNGVFLVVTLLAGEPVPAAVTSLWKDGLLDRLELQALSKNQTQEMVESAVGGEIDGMTAQAVWNVTRGNPLFIGELVIAGRDRGALVQAGGTWRWRPELPLGGRLQEVVGGRLGRLGAEENATLELIAAAGWLELDVLEGLAAPGTIETLERAGLIVVDRAGRRLTARTSHPIHLELVREKLPASRSRALRSLLASAVSTRGMRRRGDAVRVASWQLDTPAPPEPAVLLAAARAAPWAFTQALSEQLSGLAHPSQHRMITPRLRGEDELQAALRLALAAWEQDDSFAAGLEVAKDLVFAGRAEEAESWIRRLEGLASGPADWAQLALARSSILFWVLGRPAEAIDTLAEAAVRLGSGSWRAELDRASAGVLLNTAQPAAALATVQRLLDDPTVADQQKAQAGSTATAALQMLGRTTTARRVLEEASGRALAAIDELPMVLAELMTLRVFQEELDGRLEGAADLAAMCYELAMGQDSLTGVGIYAAEMAHLAMLRGQLGPALRRARESELLLVSRDTLQWRAWSLGLVAWVSGQMGDPAAADRAVAEAERIARTDRYFWSDVELGRAWAAAARGDVGKARTIALSAAGWASGRQLASYQAVCLHEAVRLRASPHGPAAELTALCTVEGDDSAEGGSGLLAAMAAHARAVAEADGRALDAVSETFEAMGANLWAAEASAEAATAHRRAQRAGLALAAAARSRMLAERCPGAVTPALRLADVPITLTARELEIATLAASGLSNREVADRLVVSVRTVENHLYRIFARLGVRSRAELAPFFPSKVTAKG